MYVLLSFFDPSSYLWTTPPPIIPTTLYHTINFMNTTQYHMTSSGVLLNPILQQHSIDNMAGNLHVATINPNAVRGNHLHTSHDEILILMHGIYIVSISSPQNQNQQWNTIYNQYSIDVNSNDGVVALQLYNNTCHAVKNIGNDIGWFVSYYIKQADSNPSIDVQRDICNPVKLT